MSNKDIKYLKYPFFQYYKYNRVCHLFVKYFFIQNHDSLTIKSFFILF